MGILVLIGQFLKAMMFFLELWVEKDKEQAERKKVVANEIVEAFKQTDPKLRASRLNSAVFSINELRR